MENRSHALIAGLFTLVLCACVVAALLWFGDKQEATKEYLVSTGKNVTGLNVQAQVRFRGIRVGKVESIELAPNDARNTLIRIRIKKDIPVTQGTRAKLGYQGVTGIAHVLLEDGGKNETLLTASSGELARIPMQDSLIEELSDAGGEAMRRAKDFLVSANQVLSPENLQNISRILAHLEATTGNARQATDQLRQVLSPENVRLLNSTLVRAEQAVGEAAPFIAEARSLVLRLHSVSEKIENTLGEASNGGAGALLPQLNELSTQVSSSSNQLNRVLRMLEDSPQSLIFGRQAAQPGPGENGFVTPANAKELP